MSEDFYNVVRTIKKSYMSFFYDSFTIGDDFLIYLDDLTHSVPYCTDGNNYLSYKGNLLYGVSGYATGELYDFYFSRISFEKSLKLYVSFSNVSEDDNLRLFLWLNRTSKKKLLFSHTKLICGSFDYEREKGLFISDCVKKGLVLDRKYYSS